MPFSSLILLIQDYNSVKMYVLSLSTILHDCAWFLYTQGSQENKKKRRRRRRRRGRRGIGGEERPHAVVEKKVRKRIVGIVCII